MYQADEQLSCLMKDMPTILRLCGLSELCGESFQPLARVWRIRQYWSVQSFSSRIGAFFKMTSKPAILSEKPLFEEFVPIVRPWLPEFGELSDDVAQMLESGSLTKGRHLEAFENAAAEHLGVSHAIGVSSCTVGLFLTYIGLGLTGEVVVPSFTFMATVSALTLAGLRPVFADVDRNTMNLDPAAAEAAITPRTSAIVAVHNFGNPAGIVALERLARNRGLKLIFDAAHGFGSLYRGSPVGRHGDAQIFSLSPTKLVIGGEGGLVATDNAELAERLRVGREYGHSTGYDSAFAGINGRMAEFNALLALRSLNMLDRAVSHRNSLAELYRNELERIPGVGFQSIHPGDRSSYKDFCITIDADAFGITRDALVRALAAENIDSRMYYSPAVHEQTAYRKFFNGEELPNTDFLSRRCISPPMWSHLQPEVVKKICEALTRIHEHAQEIRSL